MRRGRATLPHPDPVRDDTGRILISRQHAAVIAGRHIDHIRKLVDAVACDVRTRVVLLDLDDVEDTIAGRPFADWKRRKPLELE